MIKKIAILANGGDVAGLNPVIRAIVKTAANKGIEAYGFIDGFKGLLENNYITLDPNSNVRGLINKGGCILGSSTNTIVFHYPVKQPDGTVEYKDLSDQCVRNFKEDGFDVLFTLGGDSTQKSARDLFIKGINCIGVPKTIDNDVRCTDFTFGYDTAVSVATDAIDRLHTTAETHHRIMVLEVMGRNAGWIALAAAVAGGADVCLIPEIPYDINKAALKIKNRMAIGKSFSVVVVAEGAKPINGEQSIVETSEGAWLKKLGGAGDRVAKELQDLTGLEARCTTLGYMQRGGCPTSYDRVLSTKYGVKAMELALDEKFGVLAVFKDGKLSDVPLEDVVGENKELGAVEGGTGNSGVKFISMDDELLLTARDVGIAFGD